MARFFLRRLRHTVFVLFAISLISFFFIHLSGDPVMLMLPADASAEQIEAMRERLGFDDPLHVQYLRFLGGVLTGDLGNSLYYHVPVMELVLDRLPASLELALAAMAVALLVAIPVGVLSAVKRGSLIDFGSMLGALFGLSMPHFWLGIMMMLLFSVTLGWLPTSGRGTLAHLVMPATALGVSLMAMFARLTRSVMLEVLSLDYVRTARAKGLSEALVIGQHAFKNALIPIVTVAGMEFGFLLGGTVVIETVFGWPGLGRLVVEAIFNRDYPLVQASVLVLAMIFVLVNLAVDLIYGCLDPQIRVFDEGEMK
ncbi:nickel ABC transporter permease [Ferruginivarius sediminum]|uniref:ABC transporter permease n=1 Tax=Ferruginivarius sediminum TaxID=2661937 RepID=A0A369TI83_9PROT|nr:nickel ABC transporter permease [Ferruginivarius sediminum]RDD63837.1 ABC transporter permease [Ferruginivarius sediminum]